MSDPHPCSCAKFSHAVISHDVSRFAGHHVVRGSRLYAESLEGALRVARSLAGRDTYAEVKADGDIYVYRDRAALDADDTGVLADAIVSPIDAEERTRMHEWMGCEFTGAV